MPGTRASMGRRRPLRYRGLSQRHVDAYQKGVLPWLRRFGRGFARLVIEPFDFMVGVAALAAGVAFAIFLAFDGASVAEVGLVLILVVALTAYWAVTSWAIRWWRSRRR